MKNKILALILLAGVFITGCGSENQSVKEKNSEVPKVEEKTESNNKPVKQEIIQPVQKIFDESLENITIPQLEQEIIGYVENNPNERYHLINYVLNLRMIELQSKNPQAVGEGTAFLLNSLPGVGGIIGGIVNDSMTESFLEDYKKTLTAAAKDYSYVQNAVEKNKEFLQARGKGYEVLTKLNSPENLSAETYNTEMKIAEIMYRSFAAMVDENKVRAGLKIPDALDLLDFAKYHVFDKNENLDNIKNSAQALENIYAALWVDMEHYSDKKSFDDYYNSLIPQWLFPFEFEQTFLPQSADDFLISEKSYSNDYNEKIYSIFNAEWTSLFTGETKLFYINPANEHRTDQQKINTIYALAKNSPFVVFDDYFITPALRIKDGKRENVLLMYVNYKLLGGEGFKIENVGAAKDVLIRNYDTTSDFNHFDNEKFSEKYYEQITPNYLFRDKLKMNFNAVPKAEADMRTNLYFDNFSAEDKKNIYGAINGDWKSLNSGEIQNFNINPANDTPRLNTIYAIGKSAPFLAFNVANNPHQFFITPAKNSEGKNILVMYVDYKFVDFNGQSEGYGYAQNLRVDNIKSAEDVLIKVSR